MVVSVPNLTNCKVHVMICTWKRKTTTEMHNQLIFICGEMLWIGSDQNFCCEFKKKKNVFMEDISLSSVKSSKRLDKYDELHEQCPDVSKIVLHEMVKEIIKNYTGTEENADWRYK